MIPARRLPPHGKAVASALGWSNSPGSVLVTVGADCWRRARNAAAWRDTVMVLPDGEEPLVFAWPVNGLVVVVEVGPGPADEALVELVQALLRDGAVLVAVARVDWRGGVVVYDRSGSRRDLSPVEVNAALGRAAR